MNRPTHSVIAACVLVTVIMSGTGCAIEEVLPEPSCIEGGTVILAAQSVPTAELVPCFQPLPAGWTIVSVTIDQDGTRIRFDSDRAGERAAIFRYAPTCDPGEAVPAPSEFELSDRFEFVGRVTPSLQAQRFYVFDGGCAWWDFDFDEGATAALAIELGDRLDLVSRAELNRSIKATFINEEV